MSTVTRLINRKRVTLTNQLDRFYVQQLIANADTLQADLAIWRPLYVMTNLERNILASLTEDTTLRDVLARLPIQLTSTLEQSLLAEDIAAFAPQPEPSVTYAEYMAQLVDAGTAELWYRFNEANGDLINHGSAGTGFNGVVAACAQGEEGALGAGEAYLFDGATSVITVPSPDSQGQLLVGCLTKVLGAGEFDRGRFIESFASLFLMNIEITVMKAEKSGTGSGVNANSAATAFPTTNAWAWQFAYFDFSADKKIYLYEGISGSVNEYAYSTQTAMTWTGLGSDSALYIGNRSPSNRTFDGYFDEVFVATNISVAEAAAIMDAVTAKASV